MEKQAYRHETHTTASPQEKEKFTFKEIMVIVFAWLMALSLVYICYLKFSILLHH